MPTAEPVDSATAILQSAMALLESEGPHALTTRAVCEAAGIKAPTLYHHFGGKEGLERALVARGVAEFMQKKRRIAESADPLEQLWAGWSLAVDFALGRPALHRLYARLAMDDTDVFADAYGLMQARVQRLVDLGVFQGPVDRSARLVWSASQGALALILQGHGAKDVRATSELLWKAVVAELRGQPPA